MQDTKPNRAQRRAAQSNSKPKCQTSRRSFELTIRHIEKQLHSTETRPQIDAPSRATRFTGMT